MALLMGALVKRKRGQLMKILIVGGVAAGTKAAAKLKRLNPAADVTILTKDEADEDAIRQAIRDAGYLPLRTTEKE